MLSKIVITPLTFAMVTVPSAEVKPLDWRYCIASIGRELSAYSANPFLNPGAAPSIELSKAALTCCNSLAANCASEPALAASGESESLMAFLIP